jgi:hypothetical protein
VVKTFGDAAETVGDAIASEVFSTLPRCNAIGTVGDTISTFGDAISTVGDASETVVDGRSRRGNEAETVLSGPGLIR